MITKDAEDRAKWRRYRRTAGSKVKYWLAKKALLIQIEFEIISNFSKRVETLFVNVYILYRNKSVVSKSNKTK